MPSVTFEGTNKTEVTVEAPAGARLADLADENAAPIPFSCRSASCGTCRSEVVEGAEHLSDPEDEELDVLDIFGDDPKKKRLCCQARLRETAPADARVRLRALNEL
jgi:2Fe-2S ferredoxin